MKIELPADKYTRVWQRNQPTGEILEWRKVDGDWVSDKSDVHYSWTHMLTQGPVYTEHPYTEILKKFPAPWTVGPSGTIRSRGNRVILDPTLQCPSCLTGFFVYLVNEFAAKISSGAAAGECAADEEDEKK